MGDNKHAMAKHNQLRSTYRRRLVSKRFFCLSTCLLACDLHTAFVCTVSTDTIFVSNWWCNKERKLLPRQHWPRTSKRGVEEPVGSTSYPIKLIQKLNLSKTEKYPHSVQREKPYTLWFSDMWPFFTTLVSWWNTVSDLFKVDVLWLTFNSFDWSVVNFSTFTSCKTSVLSDFLVVEREEWGPLAS